MHVMNRDNIFEQYSSISHDSWAEDVDLVIIFDVGDFKRIRTLCDGKIIESIIQG